MNHQSNDLGIPRRVNSSIRWYYIFSLSKSEVEDFDDEASKRWLKENPNMKWSLDERGTKGVFEEPLEYERLSKEFKKLSKK
jgi:hypothetical protein